MKKVLIVDDEVELCEMIKKNLLVAGPFDVKVCNDGNQAIMLAKSFHPDIIFLDVMMPGKSGSAVAQELKDTPETSDIPVVFLTAIVSERETKKTGPIIGGAYFLPKPVNIADMLGFIKELAG